MAELNEVFDRLHYENRRDYTNKRGGVRYLDGTPLTRPLHMPASQRVIALVIVVIAVIIGFVLVNTFVLSHIREIEETEKTIQSNLARPASIESIPNMMSLVSLDDDAIRAEFDKAGYKMFDASGRNGTDELVLYRVPDDMTLDDVAADYMTGMSALSPEEASKLLEGGWQFSADRKSGSSMVVRYADFSTADPQIAIQNAIRKEGFDVTTMGESGEDETGNTFSSGTFVVDEDVTCTWRVSALPLDDVYSIKGLSENACYVGVRVNRP